MPPTIALLLLSIAVTSARIYDRCELARELKYVYEFPAHEVPTWVCIVAHESIYDTAAMNPGSGDHGLFQISQLFWCSPPGDGFGCNAPCVNFRDDDIADDVKCVRRIFKEHSRISGDGFNAWAVYPLYCKGDNGRYVRGCFDNEIDNSVSFGEEEIPVNASSTQKPFGEEDEDEGYEFPPLPSPPKKAYENSISGEDEVYEFPPLPIVPTTQETPSERFQAGKQLKLLPDFINTDATTFTANTERFFTTPSPTEASTTSLPSSSVANTEAPSTIITRSSSATTTLLPPKAKSTSSYISKKLYSAKSVSKSVFKKPKQITFRPFIGRPNITVTQRPIVNPPRPARPLGSRPTIRPFTGRPSVSRPVNQRPSRPTLRPFSRLTADSNKNTVVSSTTPLYSVIQTTSKREISSEAKTVYTSSTLPQELASSRSTTTIRPISTSVYTTLASPKIEQGKVTGKLPVELKMGLTLKPPSSVSKIGTNGNNLKREERLHNDEFPGYFFSRTSYGFKLIQKL